MPIPRKKAECTIIHGECVPVMEQLGDCAALVLGSPEYCGKGGRYRNGEKYNWTLPNWVRMMQDVVKASLRAAPLCLFVANDPVEDGRYIPATDTLNAVLHKEGVVLERPLVWSKNAPPTLREWWSNTYERILAYKRFPDSVVTWNWEAIADPTKYKNGGNFRQRGEDGERRKGGGYPQGELARPRDILRATVGGGHMGHALAHENEAPYPESLIEPIILALTNPGDLVLDPFCGSGTSLAVALKHGRRAIGIDRRLSQCQLTEQRILDECGIECERRSAAIVPIKESDLPAVVQQFKGGH